ncbi:MAG: hypothetical protein OHK0028_08550 [Deltaproteobacteria bacterium]
MIPARWLLAAILPAVLFPAGPATGDDGEELPRILLEKKVYSDTAGGKRRFFETRTVEKGETLWKILERDAPLTPDRYAERLKEFRRANPRIADPSRLVPGQKILVPSGGSEGPEGVEGTVGYRVRKGDALLKILASRGVPRGERRKYLAAVREINPSVTDVNRIRAGETLLLPTPEYFARVRPPAAAEPAAVAAASEGAAADAAPPTPSAPAVQGGAAPAPEETVAAPAAAKTAPEPPEPPAREAASVPGQDALAPGKPEAELLAPRAPAAGGSVLQTGKTPSPKGADAVVPPSRSPYRGLLSDLFNALGEKWVDRGTMYLPLDPAGDLVLQLHEFPIVRFSGGSEVLVDFRGGIPPRVRDAISSRWKSIRVVSLADAGGAGDRIDRILSLSGYHSVKEGITRPLVMGETVSVSLPAHRIIQRAEDSLLSGDLVLLKEVPEKPGAGLLAVLRYARRVGVRVLPYADDPKAGEGFLVGIGDEAGQGGIPVALAVPPAGGLAAVDFGLELLGIPSKQGERLRVGGKGDGFQLVVSPERVFEAGGRKFVVDTGRISPGIRAILRESGYAVFPAGKEFSGRDVMQRLMKAAAVRPEDRRDFPVAGGAAEGYEVRVTGSFLNLPGPPGGTERKVVFVRRKVHSATRVLLRDLGVEIVEW